MSPPWQPIYLSAKVFGHLSQGLYRTPAGAVKELISNSFDADAKLVRIHTGFPKFETFSCEDDGRGMSRDEFLRLMDRGIGTSYKRAFSGTLTPEMHRPVIGRLGLGILSLAQICTRFEIVAHHEESKTAFRATIAFPPYTRAEMDRLEKEAGQSQDAHIEGGRYQIFDEAYDGSKRGVRVYTKYLREPFRKRMRSLSNYGNTRSTHTVGPYKSFATFMDAIYNGKKRPQSLNLLSDYDQLLFGLALAAPLPYLASRNVAVQFGALADRQSALERLQFGVQVDNLALGHPLCLPSDREGRTSAQCEYQGVQVMEFDLTDGPTKEPLTVTQHTIAIRGSEDRFHLYDLSYENSDVAGSPLAFSGYLFQQTGRLYPRDIQGVLVRLQNVAIGRYDNSMLTYPYAEGPRYSMVSGELFVEDGFEDALNIDRDSFNELHPHYIRAQSYVHSLLHERIFPETWTEEKDRNRQRRSRDAEQRETRFVERYRSATGDAARAILRTRKPVSPRIAPTKSESPVGFGTRREELHVDWTHPLLARVSHKRKHAPLVEKVIIAFERANMEPTAEKRRSLFYRLITEIFADL